MSSFSTAAANNPATAAPVAGPRFQVLHSDQSASGSASGSSTGARTGRLEFNAPDDAHPPRAMLTPSSLFCARLGTPLSLTMDMCRAEPLLAGFHDSLSLLAQNGEQVMRQYGKGIHKFMHADEYIFYMSTRDVLAATVDGMGGDKQVAVDVATGRIKVEPEGFVKYLDVAMPDMVASLSDNIVGGTAGTKRIEKSIQRTDKFLDDTLDRISKLPEGSPAKNVAILAVVQGSQDKASRIRAASTAASKLVFGFLLEGFNTGEDQLQRLELIEAAVSQLPHDKLRVIHGLSAPEHILQAVSRGIDLFDSAYPVMATTEGRALVFDFAGLTAPGWDGYAGRSMLDLWDSRNDADTNPFLPGCTCYACTRHTRAYVHHLLNTHEMLGSVLLMSHNVHHFLSFFAAIRKTIEQGTFVQHRDAFLQRYTAQPFVRPVVTSAPQ